MKRDKLIEELEEFAAEYPSDCGVYKTLKQAAQMLREDGEEIKKLKGELEKAHNQYENTIETAWNEAQDEIGQTRAERDKYKAAMEKIAYNISLSMPAAHGDEVAWYRGQAQAAIGTAARALAQSLNPTLAKEPKEGGECEECGGSRYLEREYPVSTAIDPSGKRTYKRTCDYCKPEGHDPTGQEEKCVHDFDEISGECRECGLPTKPEVEDE